VCRSISVSGSDAAGSAERNAILVVQDASASQSHDCHILMESLVSSATGIRLGSMPVVGEKNNDWGLWSLPWILIASTI
jgi:hypothetical protein